MLKSIGAAIVLALSVASAQAQPACNTRDAIAKRLTQEYNEVQIWTGVITSQYIAELWMNQTTKTWTILSTRVDGQACVVAVGQDGVINPWVLREQERAEENK